MHKAYDPIDENYVFMYMYMYLYDDKIDNNLTIQ